MLIFSINYVIEMFPDTDREMIEDLYVQCGQSKKKLIELLLRI